jgi:hypothetical protein
MARRSGRFKAVDEDGDVAMGREGMLDDDHFPFLPPCPYLFNGLDKLMT